MKQFFFLVVLLFPIMFTSAQQQSGRSFWHSAIEQRVPQISERRYIQPKHYYFSRLELLNLKELASLFPHEKQVREGLAEPYMIELPMPDGNFQKFMVAESPVMEQGLAVRYPEIKTYAGYGVTDPYASIRFDITPAGFHAQVLTPSGAWYIDPYSLSTNEFYISYYKKDMTVDPRRAEEATCVVIADEEIMEEIKFLREQLSWERSGAQLRTYRTAIATTGEYTTFHGGTVVLGLAAVVTALNRVSGIYETEAAIRMNLIANNDLIIYTNASTDPYTNNNGSTMLTQNVNNLNSVIGNANFDVGHVFSTGGGGIAGLGVICGSSKARGVTGLPSPVGDPFYVDYVAHEMGHQFGGNHTFNGSSGSCSGGNRNGPTAYEPGSGTTIMAYAGICSPQNTQNFSDPYFHGISLDEIIAFSTLGGGNNCPVITPTNNDAPAVTVPAGGFTIPKSTPFSLTGSAVDPNGDSLTYCWEQFDLGATGAPGSPVGNAPIFRSFKPVASPTRYFPKLADVINNTYVMGEILPSYARTLTFRLTARDNRSGGGGMGKASLQFSVTDAAGPFLVTSPNTAVTWDGSTTQTIQWDVAGTNAAPVNTQFVRILLSTNGGLTFPHVILESTLNDGAEQITLPNLPTTTARIKIEAVGNIYYDMSNANFTIVDNPVPVELTSFTGSVNGNTALIEWVTATEMNNKGFRVERRKESSSWQQAGYINGRGNSVEVSRYQFTESGLETGVYFYRLIQEDYNGTSKTYDAIEVEISRPDVFSLNQNYPNPFNPATSISFSLPVRGSVVLDIYSSLGEKVATLVNEIREAGYHQVSFDASQLTSGTYIYTIRVSAGNASSTDIKKMILVK